MRSQFTPQQLKARRAAGGLSQARVATDLNINRTYLSQFESGKYLFDDATLARLRDYFAKKGVPPESIGSATENAPTSQSNTQEVEESGPGLRDGFRIPDSIDEGQVESLLTEYAEGRRRIAELCAFDLSKSRFLGLWIDEDDAEKRANEVLALMARNFAVVEELQGHASIRYTSTDDDIGEKKTVLDFVRVLIFTQN